MATSDRDRVEQLLGRAPQGAFTVVVRDRQGDPLVIRNSPLLDDGTPMPTLYWLVGPDAVRAVSQLEAAGGVRDAEAATDPASLAGAHARYAAERDAELPNGYRGPRPSGGVGGTRQGVKCLHAHYAWHLAGGDDPVGQWVAQRLGADANWTDDISAGASTAWRSRHDHPDGSHLHVIVEPDELRIELPGTHQAVLDVGPSTLANDELTGADPPMPEQLTNALGSVADRFENLVLERPDIVEVEGVVFSGDDPVALARVEAGTDRLASPVLIDRDDIEEVFRMVATEPAADRALNPGLAPERVDTIIATCCIVLAVTRRLDLEAVTVA